jgi:Fe-S-cluster containining protein
MSPTHKNTTSSPWYSDGLSFQCQRSGNCCTGPPGFVWFNEQEAAVMAGQLGLEVKAFLKQYARLENGRWTLDEQRNGNGDYDCVFLNRDDQGQAICSMYKARPTQCRTWPFWPENLKSRHAWERAAQKCPGMAIGGKHYSLTQIRIIASEHSDEL